jgi:hypothetical protein
MAGAFISSLIVDPLSLLWMGALVKGFARREILTVRLLKSKLFKN